MVGAGGALVEGDELWLRRRSWRGVWDGRGLGGGLWLLLFFLKTPFLLFLLWFLTNFSVWKR